MKSRRAAAQDNHTLVAVGPLGKGQNHLEGLAADHQRVDGGHELVVAMGLAATRGQKVELAVRPRNETINAGPDKDRYLHGDS